METTNNFNLNISLTFNQLIQLVKQLSEQEKQRLRKVLAKESKEEDDTTQTYFASENVLAKDWLKPEEDEAWKDL